jgi:hypothetical protein
MQTLCWSQYIYIYIYMTLNRIVDFINVTKINHLNMIIMLFFMVWHYWAKGLTSSPPTHLLAALGPIYTRSQGPKKLELTLSIFGLLIGPKLLVNGSNIGPKDCKIGSPNSMVSFFLIQPWGPIQGHKVQHLLVNLGQIENIFLLCQTWLLV